MSFLNLDSPAKLSVSQCAGIIEKPDRRMGQHRTEIRETQ